MSVTLKPCPACESAHVQPEPRDTYISCGDLTCLLEGPGFDPNGAKWNALPRRSDVPDAMSDGELIVRALRSALGRVEHAILSAGGGGLSSDPNDPSVDAELDRRAAARKPVPS